MRGEATANSDLEVVVLYPRLEYWRYTITGLLDDLAEPPNDGEARAIVASLCDTLGNHWLRNAGRWGGPGAS